MKPTSPEQLARLLDQLSGSYPNGIPLSVIHNPVEDEPLSAEVSAHPRYHIFVAGEEETLSPAAKELLAGITSKGLKISEGEYLLSYGNPRELADRASESSSLHVVVFGADRNAGWGERTDGRAILFTHTLEKLGGDPALKKELWRNLQAILG